MNAGKVRIDFSRGGSMELSADRHGRLILRSPYSFRDQAKAIPNGRWVREAKVWRYPPKIEVLQALRPYLIEGRIVPDQYAQPILVDIGRQEKAHQKGVRKATDIKQSSEVELTVPLKTSLRPYQKKAAAVGLSLPHAALLMEQGTGKTLAAIAVAGQRFLRGEVRRLLVVAPVSVLPVWALEFRKHASFPYTLGFLSSKRVKKQSVEAIIGDTPGLQVAVVNYESLWRIEDAVTKWQPDMVILDESQKIKNGRAKQSKACHRIGDHARFRMILTGTPVTQRPLDVWSQYRFLESSIFGSRFMSFRSKYAIMGGYGGYEVVGYRDLDKLAERAHSIAFRVTKEDAKLDLPPVTDQVLHVQLRDSAKTYRDFAQKMVTVVQGKRVSAPIIITQLLRLQQIAGGFIGTGSDGERGGAFPVGTEKLDLLEEFIEDFPQDRKLVVFARFTPELRAIAERLTRRKEKFAVLDGSTTKEKRGKIVDAFQDGDTRILLIQSQTGSLGITLTAAATAVFYSMTFSYADYEQARARIHRIGQKLPVTYVHLVARGTVDEDVIRAVREKRDIAELVIDKYNPTNTEGGDMGKKRDKKKVFRIEDDPEASGGEDLVGQAVHNLEREFDRAAKRNQTQTQTQTEGDDDMAKSKKQKAKEKAAAKEAKAKKAKKTSRDGATDEVTLSQICSEKKVKPADLRKALRASKIKKPGDSWRWPKGHADIKAVEKLASELKD